MRENGTGDGSGDTSSSSFMVIGDSGGGGGGGTVGGNGNDHGRHHFVRTLDSKLKKLQRHHAGAGPAPTSRSRKPVFVTTVKTGIFLDPPPDLAALLGLDDRSSADSCNHLHQYYSYSSEPRVLYDKHHQHGLARTAARKTDRQPDFCKQMGYTNIMHDKRVVRGSNFAKKTYRPKWNPYFGYAKQLSSELGKESSAAHDAEIRRRTMARKKAMDYQTRALRLHLGAPKFTRGRQHVDIQTSTHLEELYEYPPCQTFGAQTEFDLEQSLSHPGTGTSTGTDASTQVDDKDLFDFDTEVTPIAEALITDVFKRAILEILYEEELDARARQQRALYLRRTIEEIENQRLEHEDERLKKVIVNDAQKFNDKTQTSELTLSRVVDLLPEVLNENGLTIETVENPEFVSWLVEELQAETEKHIDISDDILKNIIDRLVKHRLDTEVFTDVQSIQKPKELFEEIESITLQPDPKIDTDSRTNDS